MNMSQKVTHSGRKSYNKGRCCMRQEVSEWIAKAEGDFRTAWREWQVTDEPNFDAVCFHAQQCVEKYLKARLIQSEVPFRRIHDLEALLNLVLPIEPDWEHLREGLQQLTDMAVEIRYPGLDADAEDAAIAIEVAKKVRETARAALGMITITQVDNDFISCSTN